MNTTESSTPNTGTAIDNNNNNNSNNNKYDRQLRLWGSRGQYHVSHTCLVAVHVTAVATETIKNCILPGLQHVHIIDLIKSGRSPTTSDSRPHSNGDEPDDDDTLMMMMNQEYASNFFLTSTATTTRAATALQHLLELNPDVTGSHETYETTTIHNNNNNNHGTSPFATTTAHENGYNRFQLKLQELQSVYEHVIVLGSDIDQTTIQDMLLSISSLSNDIPFLTVHAYGLMGILQIQYLPLHPIVNPSGGGGGGQNNQQIAGTVPDLRLSHPFPLLKEYMDSFIETHFTGSEGTTSALSTHEYGNIPYPILLYHTYHTIWKRQYPNIAKPTSMEQKLEFQRLIQHHYHETTSTTTTTNRNDLPVNVQEAIQNSYLAYTERTVDRSHLQSLWHKMTLQHQRTTRAMNRECVKCFMLLQAIDTFMSRPTESSSPPPPVHGTIPDMTASTNAYMELQSIYKQQCQMDVSLLRSYLQVPPFVVADSTADGADLHHATWIDDDYIRTFCFHLHEINVMSCHRHLEGTQQHCTEPMMEQQHDDDHNDDDKDNDPELSMILDDYTDNDVNDDVQIPLLWYICYEAAQAFHQNAHRYPGEIDPSDMEQEPELLRQDAMQLQGYIVRILQDDPKYTGLSTHPVIQRTLLQPYHDPSTNPQVVDETIPESRTSMTVDHATTTMDDAPDRMPSKYAVEMVRYGNGEIHVVASIMGGVAAQEMIKIITYQYVPLDNTHVYNGITSTGAVYRL